MVFFSTDPSCPASPLKADEGGKSHEMLLDMLKTGHKAVIFLFFFPSFCGVN